MKITKSEFKELIREALREELRENSVSKNSQLSEAGTDSSASQFKKEFISWLLKEYPEHKASWEALNKFEFRLSGRADGTSSVTYANSLEIFDGIITFSRPFAEDRNYFNCFQQLFGSIRRVAQVAKKIARLYDDLEDVSIYIKPQIRN